ncbi:MAG: hypothetical protein K2X42_03240, partial [Burkholderiaceae bacterium]|nr:hypothetical protein [Burkholderiaceae bacterium]
AGGGSYTADPKDEHGSTAMETVFQVDVEAVGQASLGPLGSRAYVSFEHEPEPIAWRWWRQLRRQFLSHLQL